MHPVLAAELEHATRGGRALVEKREAHLVADDRYAAGQHQPKVCGVEVGEPQVADHTLAAQLVEMEEAVEIAGIGVAPRVELQQIETLDAEATARQIHRLAY
jgi:hypothetical protein